MTEEKSKLERIEETLNEIAESLPKKKRREKKEKDFKIPFNAKVIGKKLKENYITVQKINENGNITFLKEKIIDQTVLVDGVPRIASGEHVLRYKRRPLMIIPTWSVVPFSPAEQSSKSLTDGSNSTGYRLLMNRMQTEVLKIGKKLGGIGIGIGALIIGGIILYALLSG